MASTEQGLRREIEQERARLTEAVDTLREEVGEAADVGRKVRSKLPLFAAAGAFGLGFLKAGGVRGTMRLLFRRRHEGGKKAAIGRFRRG